MLSRVGRGEKSVLLLFGVFDDEWLREECEGIDEEVSHTGEVTDNSGLAMSEPIDRGLQNRRTS